MTTTNRRRRALILVVGVLGIGWLVYDPCYCRVFDMNPFSPLHLKALPTGCEVLRLPDPWDERDDLTDHQRAAVVTELEFRQAPDRADEILVAQRTRSSADYIHIAPGVSRLKYKLRFPALIGRVSERIHGVLPISEQEWNRGLTLQRVWDDKSKDTDFQGLYFEHGGVDYGRSLFPKTEPFYWIRPALMTAEKQRLAVFSYGGPELRGNAALDPDWYARPWRNYTIDVYDVSSGSRLALIRAWSCHGGEFNDFAWHGEKLLSLPLDGTAQQILVCGFK